MEDRIEAQHDWPGWGFGCLLWLQGHSNKGLKWTAGSAPCTSGFWCGGIHWFWAKWEKEENHGSHRSVAWLEPLCSHHRLTVGPLQFLDMKQEIKNSSLYSPRITEGTNWDIPGLEKTAKQVLSLLLWACALCVHQSWNSLTMTITQHQSFSGRKPQPKYSTT